MTDGRLVWLELIAFGEADFTRKVPFGFEGFKGIGIVASDSDPADRAGLERHLSKSGI